MSKHRVTLFDLGYGLAGQLHVFQIPRGLRVRRATNLPLTREGKNRYWLAQVPPAYKKDQNFLSLYNGYGILLEENETGYMG